MSNRLEHLTMYDGVYSYNSFLHARVWQLPERGATVLAIHPASLSLDGMAKVFFAFCLRICARRDMIPSVGAPELR